MNAYAQLSEEHIARLIACVGGSLRNAGAAQEAPEFLYDPAPVAGSAQYENHLRNYRAIGNFVAGNSKLTLYPRTAEQVSAVLVYCTTNRIKVFSQGGNTGLVGASVPDESGDGIVLSIRKMERVLSAIHAGSNAVLVEAGAVIDSLNQLAQAHGLFCSIKHGGTGSATAGGSAATNAGGANAVKYGVTRDQVIGLQVVTPTGEIMQLGGTLKDTSSLIDLKHAYIGSAGSLGVITQVELKLHPVPKSRELAMIGFDTYAEVDALLARMQAAFSGRLEVFEFMDGGIFALSVGITEGAAAVESELKGKRVVVLTEVSSGKAADEQLQQDLFDVLAECDAVLLAMDAGQRDLFWRIREHCNPASKQHCGDRGVFFDNCVPVQLVGTSLETNERILRALFPQEMEQGVIKIFNFGHSADGNVHTHVVQPLTQQQASFDIREHAHTIEDAIVKATVELGGNPAAEHNIGVKTQRLRYADPVATELVKRIKAVFDPAGVMNPGRGLV
jgi:FAD/FMN-containing dehydrogenase